MNKERRNMSLKVKLILSYVIMCVLVFISGMVNFKQLSDIKNGLANGETIGRYITITIISMCYKYINRNCCRNLHA